MSEIILSYSPTELCEMEKTFIGKISIWFKGRNNEYIYIIDSYSDVCISQIFHSFYQNLGKSRRKSIGYAEKKNYIAINQQQEDSIRYIL